ncbi:GAF and ANTAR domain-containing protein [Pedococcus soli]
MSEAPDRLHRLQALVDVEAPADVASGLAGKLDRICGAAVRILAVAGVGVSLMDRAARPLGTIAASSPLVRRLEEVQFTLGEGPSVEASSARSPVLEDDLTGSGARRWPAYAAAAQEQGVNAVFAFPIHVGAARLGAMVVYRHEGRPLDHEVVLDALGLARICLNTMLSVPAASLVGATDGLGDGLGLSSEVYQAQGVLTVQLGVPLSEAMLRLRARAYATERSLEEIAADVLAGRIDLTRDDL